MEIHVAALQISRIETFLSNAIDVDRDLMEWANTLGRVHMSVNL